MDSRSVGILIVVAGVVLIGLGLLVVGGWFGWFGRLPGDLRVERENVRIYVPWVSMLLLSIVFSILIALFRRWL